MSSWLAMSTINSMDDDYEDVRSQSSQASLIAKQEKQEDYDIDYEMKLAELKTPKRYIIDFSNVLKSFIGSNFLGLPFAFRQSGLYAGIIGLIFIASITEHCCSLLVYCKNVLPNSDKIKTYGDVGTQVLGRKGKIIIDGLVVFTQLGFCVGYFIFMSKNIQILLELNDTLNEMPGRITYLIAVCMVIIVVIPLCCVKQMEKLGWSSLIADVLLLFGMAVLYSKYDCDKAHETQGFHLGTFPIFLGMVTGSYEGIGLVVPVEKTMSIHKGRYKVLLDIVLAVVSALLGSFGILGYLTFGDDTDQIITANLQKGAALTIATIVSLILAILFTFPMQMFPVTEIFDNLLFENPSLNYFDVKTNLIRFACIGFCAVVAYNVPFFGYISGLVGAFGSSLLAFCVPVVIHLKLFSKDMSLLVKIKDYVILVLGLCSMVLGTTLAIKEIVDALI